jgi:hypothetical protein
MSSLQGTNHMELFNLGHSSVRVSIERTFAALKNRFKVLDQKPFHPYDTQLSWFVLVAFFTTGS